MQMNSISKVQFGQLNDKRFYFCDGIVSLPYGHPLLPKLRDKKLKYKNIHSVIKKKKETFLQEEGEVIKKYLDWILEDKYIIKYLTYTSLIQIQILFLWVGNQQKNI